MKRGRAAGDPPRELTPAETAELAKRWKKRRGEVRKIVDKRRSRDFAPVVCAHLSAEKNKRFEELHASIKLDGSDEEEEVEEQQIEDFARAMREIPTCVNRAEIVRAGRARENWRNSHAFGSDDGVQLLASIVRTAAEGLRVESDSRGAATPAAAAITTSRGRKRGRSPSKGAAAAAVDRGGGGGEGTGAAKRPTPPTVQLLSHATQEILFPVLSAVARLARHARARQPAGRGAGVSEELVRAAVASLPPAHHALSNLLPLRGGGAGDGDGDNDLDRPLTFGGGQVVNNQ